MSATLVYVPLDPKEPRYVEITACQIRNEIQSLFGEYPVHVTKADVERLRVLEAVWRGSSNPWTALIQIIEREPIGIRLWEET